MQALSSGVHVCRVYRRGFVALLALGATLLSGPLAAQNIAVVATRLFRPTAILQPHLHYVVAADSGDSRAVLRDVGVPPVGFAGTIRIDGVQPGVRDVETHPFADTVRFDGDGRVVLLLADGAGRPPMSVEVTGMRTAPAGRIVITAPGLPIGRAILVTITPADVYELAWRRRGYGERDNLRLDDLGGMAYLTDTTAGTTTMAVGFGRGTTGRIQSDVASIVVPQDYGNGAVGRDRRLVGSLVLAIDPRRDDAGVARAEIVFGVGNTDNEAYQASRVASTEPAHAPSPVALRIATPSQDITLLMRHLFAATGPMLSWDVLGGERPIPSSASWPAVRATDAAAAAEFVVQRGDTAAVCGTYRLLRRSAGTGASRLEVAPRLGRNGRFLAVSDSTDASADAALVMLAFTCYQSSRDAAFLRAEYPALADAAQRAAQGAPGAASAEALERLAEMQDELTRFSGTGFAVTADSLRALALAMAPAAAGPAAAALWRSATTEARQGLNRDYGRLSSGAEEGGVSLAAVGAFFDLVTGELFGVTEYLDRLEIAPALDGIADDFNWQLDGWQLGGRETLALGYRPADRRATVRITASQRRRLVLRFPWLGAGSCVVARRGPDTERLTPVSQADGSIYVDVRGAYEPAEVTLSADPCP
jgi:hypothetical protein